MPWTWRTLSAGLSVTVSSAACTSGVPHPTALDAEAAAQRWPGATLAELDRGRSLFVARCSSCHPLPLPESVDAERWSEVVDDMAIPAHLDTESARLITRYLVVTAVRSGGLEVRP